MDADKPTQEEMVEHREGASLANSVAEDESGVPPGYWYSYRFLGSLTAIILLANNLFIGYSMPVSRI